MPLEECGGWFGASPQSLMLAEWISVKRYAMSSVQPMQGENSQRNTARRRDSRPWKVLGRQSSFGEVSDSNGIIETARPHARTPLRSRAARDFAPRCGSRLKKIWSANFAAQGSGTHACRQAGLVATGGPSRLTRNIVRGIGWRDAVAVCCGRRCRPMRSRRRAWNKRGAQAEAREDFDAAFEAYRQAHLKKPNDLRYKTHYERMRFQAANQHVDRGPGAAAVGRPGRRDQRVCACVADRSGQPGGGAGVADDGQTAAGIGARQVDRG